MEPTVARFVGRRVLGAACAVLLIASVGAGPAPAAIAADPPVMCGGLEATIVGTPGDDTLLGTPGVDVIVGLGGNDIIKSRKGDDIVCAGDGEDRVSAGPGNDVVYGGDDRDRMWGAAGNDTLMGDNGNDILVGQADDDRLEGGAGDDVLKGSGGDDDLSGGPGEDRAIGGPDHDICTAETQLTCEESGDPPPPAECTTATFAQITQCLADPRAVDASDFNIWLTANITLGTEEIITLRDLQNVTFGGAPGTSPVIRETTGRMNSNGDFDRQYIRVLGGSGVTVQNLSLRDATNNNLSADCRVGTHPTNPNRWTVGPCYPLIMIGDGAVDTTLADLDVRSDKALHVDVRDVDGLMVRGWEFRGATVFGFYVGDQFSANDVIFTQNTLTQTGSNGIVVANATNVTISQNTLTDNHRLMQFRTCGDGNDPCSGGQILVQDHRDKPINGLSIADNTITTSANPPLPSASGIEVGDARQGSLRNISITGNQISDQSRPAIVVHKGHGGHSNIVITGNTLEDNALDLPTFTVISVYATVGDGPGVDMYGNDLIKNGAVPVSASFAGTTPACTVGGGQASCTVRVRWQIVNPPAGTSPVVQVGNATLGTQLTGSADVTLGAGAHKIVEIRLDADNTWPLSVLNLMEGS